MNNDNTNNNSLDLGLTCTIGVILVILKLCGVIDWSWWWVTCLFWIPLAFAAFVLAIGMVIMGIVLLFTFLATLLS